MDTAIEENRKMKKIRTNERLDKIAAFVDFMNSEILDDSEKITAADVEISGVEFTAAGYEFSIFTDEEAEDALREHVTSELWAFNADFILDCCGLWSPAAEKSLKEIQGKTCEDCNDLIGAIINGTCGLDTFIDKADNADGRGHFLSMYDGEERQYSEDGKTIKYFLYRQN